MSKDKGLITNKKSQHRFKKKTSNHTNKRSKTNTFTPKARHEITLEDILKISHQPILVAVTN